MREAGGAQISGDAKGGQAFMLRSWFPWDEPMAAMQLGVTPGQAGRYALGQIHPIAKFGIEQATGRDIFRGQPQEQMTTPEMARNVPAALVGKSGTALDNLLALRPVREAAVRVPQQAGFGRQVSRAVLGGAVQELSAERGLAQFDATSNARLRELRGQIAYARDKGQMDRMRKLLAEWLRIMQSRREMGLKVPKATESALTGAGVK